MGKKARKKAEVREQSPETELFAPWISMRSGLIVMAVVSLGLAIWTAYQTSLTNVSLINSILWGIVFGGSLWLVFFGFILFNRFLRKK
jgi:uncharacterized membrane-anchored protein